MIPVQTTLLSLPEPDRREVLRYAGAKQETPELTALLDEILDALLPQLVGRVCWARFPISWLGDSLNLGFAVTQSRALTQTLQGCEEIIVFAATIGLAPDRLLARYGRLSPAKALLVQAIGTERIEALCDVFCQQVSIDSGIRLTSRFSPGYGDLPLALQSDLFAALDCPRKIGLTLNESLLMSPSKSVTAIMGLNPRDCTETGRSCSRCSKTDCTYRRMP